MTAVPVFPGRIDRDGKPIVFDQWRPQYRAWLRTLAGKQVEFIVRRQRRQRSDAQNKFLHAVVFPLLASELGDSVEGVKFDLMGEKWGWTQTTRGHHMPIKPHTAEMTVEECTEFIEWVIPWAMTTHGIQLPLPGEVVIV